MGQFSDSVRQHVLRREEIDQAIAIVRDVIDGKRDEHAVPWEQPAFRSAVVHFLRRDVPQLERDSHKLAIVKEVFGGGK